MSHTKVDSPAAFAELAGIARNLLKQSGPGQKALMAQIAEALKTGGPGADIPAIHQAVAGQTAADTQARGQLVEDQNRAGLGGSVFAQAGQAQNAVESSQRAAAIPTEIANAIAGLAPGAVNSATTTGMGLIAGEGEADLATQIANMQNFTRLMRSIKDAASP